MTIDAGSSAPTYNLGRAVPNGVLLRNNPTAARALAETINRALLPQMAAFYRQMQPVFETYIRTQMRTAGAIEAINRIVANAVSNFDGEDWARLSRELGRVYGSDQDVTMDLDLDDVYQAMQADHVELNDPEVGGEDWLVEWWRWLAALFASLYFTATISAQVEITKPDDLIAELRDNAVVAIAIYAALVSWGKKRGYK